MNTEQRVAFRHAASTSAHQLFVGITTALFVITLLWSVVVLIGQLRALFRDQAIDPTAVVVVVLFLVTV